MALQVDSLELKISTNADAANDSLSRLATTMGTLKTACTGYSQKVNSVSKALEKLAKTSDGLQGVQTALETTSDKMVEVTEKAAKADSSLAKTGDSATKSGDKAKKASGGWNKFVSSLGRIAMYRAIRAALKLISETVTQGIQDLTTFDAKLGNIYGYNKAFSEITSSFAKFRGTLAISLANIAELFIPALQTTIDIVTQAISSINSLFSTIGAVLKGQTTYLKVNNKYWKSFAENVSKTKNTLLGFDEINRLNSDNSITEDLYVEQEIPEWLKGISEIFANLPDEIKDSVSNLKALASALLTIGLASIILNIVKAMKSKNSVLGEQTNLTNGETQSVTGLANAFSTGLIPVLLGGISALGLWNKDFGISMSTMGESISSTFSTITESIENSCSSSANAYKKMIESMNTSTSKLQQPTIHSNIGSVTLSTDTSRGQITLPQALSAEELWLADSKYLGKSLSEIMAEYNATHKRQGETIYTEGIGDGAGIAGSILSSILLILSAVMKGMSLGFFADGGTPNIGSLFWAGEAGPELVAQVGGRTTVYNTDQLNGELAKANDGVINAIENMGASIVSAISRKNVGVSVNDVRLATNSMNMRYAK